MSTLPRRCLGCGTKIPAGSRCTACTSRKANTTARGYGAAWQRLARQAIASHPWCVDCGTTADLTADHIVPIALGGQRLDPANVTVRCRPCTADAARPFGEVLTRALAMTPCQPKSAIHTQ